jgi:hypothetical protein
MLPSGVTPSGTVIPTTRTLQTPPEMPPAVPKPSTLSVSPEDLQSAEIPDATGVSYQNPILQRRLPSAALLENYGAEPVQPLPNVEESADETTDKEMPNSISTSRPNAARSITFHSAQLGAGQSLQTHSAPVSVSMAQSRTLPSPYSPNNTGYPTSRRPVASIEQVGYQKSIETGNSISTTTSQNQSVVHINNAQTR